MSMTRLKVVVATDGPIAKYGGVALAAEALHGMAKSLNTGNVPMRWNHDPRRPLRAENLVARVEELPNGRIAVVAEFDVDSAAWAEIEAELNTHGVPGGFSYTATTPIAVIGAGNGPVMLAAEAGYFTEGDVLAAADHLATKLTVDARSLFQFSAQEEVARVAIDLGSYIASAIGVNMLSSLLYDAIKLLLKRKRQPGPTMLDVRFCDDRGVQTQAVIVTSDPEIAGEAMRSLLERMDRLHGIVEYRPEDGSWEQKDV